MRQLGLSRREVVVLVFLTATFLVGAGVSQLRHARLVRSRPALETRQPAPLPSVRDSIHMPLNLNHASTNELEALPGIGPKLAQRIVEYREQHGRFGSLNELRRVPGIGPKRLAALRDLVTVGEP